MRGTLPRFSLFIVVAFYVMVPSVPARAVTPLHFWSQRFGSTGTDGGQRVAVDANGDVFVVGYFSGTVDLGGGGLVSAGGNDIFVAKYNAAGVHLWSKRFGSTGDDVAHGVAVDGFGNVFVTGHFNGTVDFGGGGLVSASGSDIFLVRFSSNGVHQWSKRFGGVSSDLGKSLAIDASGNVLLTGYVATSADFGGGTLTSAGSFDVVLAKFDTNGVHQWSHLFGGVGVDEGEGVAVDSGGNVLLIGYFTLPVDFGGGPLTWVGSNDIFLAKYDTNGSHLWSQSFGNTGDDIGVGVAVDPSDNVLVTGLFSDTVDFGGGGLVSAGGRDVFIAKYDAGGAHMWSDRMGGTLPDISFSAAVDDSGNVLVAGQVDGLITMAKYSADGVQRWNEQPGPGLSFGVAVGASDNVLFTGELSGTADFGGGALTSAGASDVFLVKYGAGLADPGITAIVDVGNDQGRQVKISFLGCGYDSPGSPLTIVQYEAYRRDDPLPAGSLPPTAGIFLPDLSPAETQWVFVGSVPAHGATDYKILAPTAADSTISYGPYYSTFFIRAATADPFTFFDSPVDSGYSLDNLAPSVPFNLVYNGGLLSWHDPTDADFDYFTVYGSTSDSFDGSAVVIDYTIGTSLDVSASPYVFYYVTATDFSGNEGPAARVNILSDIGDAPKAYGLSIGAYPNPFNPSTTLRYDVPSRGRVVIRIYDAHGARVTNLLDMERDAGSYAVPWDGTDARGSRVSSGVYFARIEVANRSLATRLVLLK